MAGLRLNSICWVEESRDVAAMCLLVGLKVENDTPNSCEKHFRCRLFCSARQMEIQQHTRAEMHPSVTPCSLHACMYISYACVFSKCNIALVTIWKPHFDHSSAFSFIKAVLRADMNALWVRFCYSVWRTVLIVEMWLPSAAPPPGNHRLNLGSPECGWSTFSFLWWQMRVWTRRTIVSEWWLEKV